MSASLQPVHAQAKTIDEVVSRLDGIIERSINEQSRLGYFAALYRNVTVKVKEGIAAGRFEDGERMERLAVTFANRYLTALDAYRSGEKPSRCWQVAFRAAEKWPPIILQHLLLGMNAHINYDLAIAAAEVAPGDKLPALKPDFDEINRILATLVNRVQDEIDAVSPWFALLDRLDRREDDAIINFSLQRSRARAWETATRLAPVINNGCGPMLDRLDIEAAMLGDLVLYPGPITPGLRLIRLRETSDVKKVIEVLDRTVH